MDMPLHYGGSEFNSEGLILWEFDVLRKVKGAEVISRLLSMSKLLFSCRMHRRTVPTQVLHSREMLTYSDLSLLQLYRQVKF